MGIDEPRDDGLARQAHTHGPARHGNLIAAADRLDVAVFDQDDRFANGGPAAAAQQGRSLEDDDAFARGSARREAADDE